MPCPLFLPGVRKGDYYTGLCSAEQHLDIPVDKLRHCCNRGYARLVCMTAAKSDTDAAQLLVRSEAAGSVKVAWSLERNHHPVAVGVITVSPGQSSATPLEAQAVALVRAYLDQKGNS